MAKFLQELGGFIDSFSNSPFMRSLANEAAYKRRLKSQQQDPMYKLALEQSQAETDVAKANRDRRLDPRTDASFWDALSDEDKMRDVTLDTATQRRDMGKVELDEYMDPKAIEIRKRLQEIGLGSAEAGLAGQRFGNKFNEYKGNEYMDPEAERIRKESDKLGLEGLMENLRGARLTNSGRVQDNELQQQINNLAKKAVDPSISEEDRMKALLDMRILSGKSLPGGTSRGFSSELAQLLLKGGVDPSKVGGLMGIDPDIMSGFTYSGDSSSRDPIEEKAWSDRFDAYISNARDKDPDKNFTGEDKLSAIDKFMEDYGKRSKAKSSIASDKAKEAEIDQAIADQAEKMIEMFKEMKKDK